MNFVQEELKTDLLCQRFTFQDKFFALGVSSMINVEKRCWEMALSIEAKFFCVKGENF